jgi:uncharacterized protein YjbJ (UPF0337 family)
LIDSAIDNFLLELVTTNTENFWSEKVMSTEDRAKATAKNVAGKAQEAVGDLTGNQKDRVEGKEKQTEASAEHAVEDVKDSAKKALD